MEKQIITLNGKDYTLPPFTAGQMRRVVSPLLTEARELQKAAKDLQARMDDPEAMGEMADLTSRSQQVMVRQGEAAVLGLNNAYPHLKLEDLEDAMTPLQMTHLFNRLIAVTMEGSNEPGEAAPQPKKRSR